MQFSFEQVGQVPQPSPRACLDGTEWDVQEIGYFTLREPSVVGELDDLALFPADALQRAVDTPRRVGLFGAFGGRRVVRVELRPFARRLPAASAAVDDRVPRHGIEPGSARAAVGFVRAGRAPDGGEGLLDGVLGAHPIAEAAQREAENRA